MAKIKFLRACRSLLLSAALCAYVCALPVYHKRSLERETQCPAAALPAESMPETKVFSERDEVRREIIGELTARGFPVSDVIVGSGGVCVLTENVSDEGQAAAIFEAVERISGCKTSNIRLIPLFEP